MGWLLVGAVALLLGTIAYLVFLSDLFDDEDHGGYSGS